MEGQAKQAYFVNEAFTYEEPPQGGGGGGADALHRRKSGGGNKELQLDMGGFKKGQEVAGGNGSDSLPPSMDFDDILPLIGEFGRYQKLLFICMIPFSFFVAFVYFSQIFLTLIPEQHWCHVPELDGLDVEARWVKFGLKKFSQHSGIFPQKPTKSRKNIKKSLFGSMVRLWHPQLSA